MTSDRSSFVHLHTHSEYSLLEASTRLKGMVKKASEDGQPALALTDNGNMFGAIEFYFACKDKNIKPILGLDVYLAPGSRHQKSQDRNEIAKPNTRLVLLAQNLEGYQNLCRLSTIGYQEGFYWKPRIDYEVLEQYNSGLIALSGGQRGEVATSFLLDGPEKALEKVKRLRQIFGDRFYLEVNRTGLDVWRQLEPFLVEASRVTGVPLVAANDVHYLGKDDQMVQEVLICIGSNKTLHDESRFKLGSNQFYLKTAQEMRTLFSDRPEWCDRTLEIADRCDLKFKLKDDSGKQIYHLPSFPTEDGRDLKAEIKFRAEQGLQRRLDEAAALGKPIADEKIPEYQKRLDYELGIIDRMGFNGYFLIVQDFINWAKTQNIPVGPGRGSGAGSLVAYSLRITDLDPIPNFLLFERFLNPERISMPDFDIDFCQDRRGEVIRYVTEKYGQASVAQIITYGKLQTRAALRDVGRVLGMTFSEVDVVSKLIPDKLNITLKESLEMEPRILELMESNPQIATMVDLAQRVEGLVRHAGIHAAGVIIADGDLAKHAPLYKGADGENVVQYDMKHAEKIGLIKFDFLGLKTLTHINNAIKIVKENRGIELRPEAIPMDDEPTFTMMSAGDTAGIFQFEGEGITDATRKIRPSSFEDITAITSLYRPGPMANIPDFTKRKHGDAQIEYLLPLTEQVLKETYGIMVYQEQVMGIASLVAGYSLGEADMLRRAMGKKIKEEMDQHRHRFMKGATERGHDAKRSEELFDLMYKFADYGFNKSHAAAYSVVTIQTAWLKKHFAPEFFAALLTTEMSDTDKIVKYSKDARKRGLLVKPPHINYSQYHFTVKGDDIYFGLGGIKGVGESAIAAIIEARRSMPNEGFESLDDFFMSVDTRRINKKVIECLIKAGALDGFGAHRAQLMAGYSKYLDRADEARKERESGQSSLFDLMGSGPEKVTLDSVKQWGRNASLSFEKEVLGFYLSDHPLSGYDRLAKVWSATSVADLAAITEAKKRVIVAGLMVESREVITKKGSRMAFGKIEDLTGACEVVIFPDTYKNIMAVMSQDKPVLLGGNLEVSEGNPKIIVDNMVLLDEAFKKAKRITMNLHSLKSEELSVLAKVLEDHPGSAKVQFKVRLSDINTEVEIESEKISGVSVSESLFEDIHNSLGRTDFVEMN